MALSPRQTLGITAFFAFTLASCNIYNPSGTGDGGATANAHLITGDDKFRDLDFSGSMESYARAIEQDSSSSLAYYGYAKAALRHYGLNASIILAEVDSAKAKGSIPFLDADPNKLTRYLQATSRVRRALSELTRRDTLTRWWQYSKDSSSRAARKDAQLGKRLDFIQDYLSKGQQGLPGYAAPAKFPLIDGAIAFEKVVVDYGFIELLYTLVHLRDLDQNDTIDTRDDLLTKLNFKSEGGFKLDSLQNIAADLQTDTAARENFNNLIQNVQSGLGSASTVINLLAPTLTGGSGSGDTLSNQQLTDQVSQNVDSVINDLGNAIGFYQFGDAKDNDGDACVDEEILDGKDNDGDGFTDEDARVVPTGVPDNVDNDHNGSKDLLDPDEALDTDFFLLFTKRSGFVTGALYKDKVFKVRVQQDSLTLRTVLTPGQRALLDSAKTQIGGCWNQY